MTFKKLIGTLHLWLGLGTGALVFIIAITGCVYAFKAEIENATQSYRQVEISDGQTLPPSILKKIAEAELPGKSVHAVLYPGKNKAAQVIFYKDDPDSYYYIAYINPYNGEVQAVLDEYKSFFRFVLDGHFNLWLPREIGKPIVASATLTFFVMVVSGLVLWWPKNKKARKQRFILKKKSKWRRKNYDLHNVLGFYACSIAVVFAITGLVWGFEWFANSYYFTVSGGKQAKPYVAPTSISPALASEEAIDRVWIKMVRAYPFASAIEVHPPESAESCIAANANPDPDTYWKIDYRYFDQYSLEEITVQHMWGRFNDLSAADKLMRMNYDVHVGAILGLPGKILAFCASLIIASLPVTGFLIWWGRRNKKRPAKKRDNIDFLMDDYLSQSFEQIS